MMEPALLLAAMAGSAAACAPAPPAGMVVSAAPFGGVVAPTAEDAAEAVAAGIVAQRAARRFLGLEPPPFLVAPASPEAELPPGCAFVFPWRFAPRRAGGPRLPSHVLPHENGNTVFIRLLVGEARAGGPLDRWLLAHAAPGRTAKTLSRLDAGIAAFVLTNSDYRESHGTAVAEKPN